MSVEQKPHVLLVPLVRDKKSSGIYDEILFTTWEAMRSKY
jgi:hypothetical protein